MSKIIVDLFNESNVEAEMRLLCKKHIYIYIYIYIYTGYSQMKTLKVR